MAEGRRIAKLSRPRLHDAVIRARLFEEVDRARRRPVVWIVGSPGAGKTTLMPTYLAARRLPAVWYQIDATDVDPASFFYFMGVAAKPFSRRRRPLPLFTPEYHANLSGFAHRFFRHFFACFPGREVLAFDNYQEAPAPAGSTLVARMLRGTVPGARAR